MAVNIDPVLVRYLTGRFPAVTAETRPADNTTVLTVPAPEAFAVLTVLCREDAFLFDNLGDLTAVDHPDRLDVVYHLYSLALGHKLAVRVPLAKTGPVLPSVTPLWPAAAFSERETYDLLGVVFSGHPDLTRILLPDGFEGHPLRKDYRLPARPAAR